MAEWVSAIDTGLAIEAGVAIKIGLVIEMGWFWIFLQL